MPNPKDSTEDIKPPKAKKPPEYRKFEKMLKQVLKAPPMRKHKET